MIHLQTPVTGWLGAVDRMGPNVTNKAFAVQQLAEIKARQPAGLTLHRYWNDPYQNVNASDTDAVRDQRARGWFDAFIDGTFLNGSTAGVAHYAAVDLISWWNEYYANSQSDAERQLWIAQERAAARIWRDEYRNGPNAAKLGHIRLTLPAAAVGNNIPWQTAETAALYDCVLDYHPYSHYINGQRSASDWPTQSGRWAIMDADYCARGFVVPWVFGEAGPYGSAIDGWRHADVCGGDVGRYVDAVRTWIRDVKQTPAYGAGRVLGFNLFTTGAPAGFTMSANRIAAMGLPVDYAKRWPAPSAQWGSFETRQPELDALADMVAQEWNDAPPPPPPGPPFTGLRLHAPLDVVAYVTSEFNDPRPYGLHEGLDFAPASGVTANVLAAAAGVVIFAGNRNGAYGNYVKTEHVYNNVTYIIYYAHLAVIAVGVGDSVAAGAVVGVAGDSGNSTGVHVHITMRVPGYGLPGYVIPDVVDPAPYYNIAGGAVQPTPATDPCRPRVPYARTYVVMAEDATRADWHAAVDRYYDQRRTIGGSYDDAGHGPNLISRNVICEGIAPADRPAFVAWYAEHYAGAVVTFAD